mmetsp:Transcript_136133/g.236607  ORF Transcript_136133/g.236607 Transcript_136133/m.236607 type:complete len:751 (+) Transcript_136133:69-2321(+)
MKAFTMLSIVLSVAALSTPAVAAGEPANPVMRVVGLLEGLSAKIEKEGKVEEGLYEDYVCWGKSVISQKTASNAAAQEEVDSLSQWIADLDANKVELTDERVTLDKEIADLSEDIESATNQREAENADFLKAEDDMKKAIAALGQAISVLGDAMAPSASLVSVRSQVQSSIQNSGGMAALMEDAATLDRAVQLGDRFLGKVDAAFLRRLLTGQVPDVDFKKLNRKATFKMSYKARSGKIMDTLKEMKETFSTNLADATTKESEDLKAYTELHTAKTAQLDEAKTARSEMNEEKGAKALSKEEAQDEIDALTDQIEDDKKWIKQTEEGMAIMKDEYVTRQNLRRDELAAVSQAINILHSDDARDLFKKSYESQAYSFLQHQAVKAHIAGASSTWGKAAALLQNAGQLTSDARLLDLARLGPKEQEAIKPVIDAIGAMISTLSAEEASDLENKETCETGRAEDTRSAIVLARTIDDMSDKITALTETIADLETKIDTANKTKMETQAQLDEATANRDAENKDFEASKADDLAAADLVTKAKEVLEKFYSDNNLKLEFLQKSKQPVEDIAGQAPTPPPETWEGAYMGATGASASIVNTLEIIHADILKDVAKAEDEEEKSLEEYNAFKTDSEKQMGDLTKEMTSLEGVKSEKATEKTDTTTQRTTKKGELNSVIDKIKETAAAGCDYFAVNYALRVKNRQIELDSLTKAKAILLGGEFTAKDPKREMAPGDAAAAFLQHAGRHLRGEMQRKLS